MYTKIENYTVFNGTETLNSTLSLHRESFLRENKLEFSLFLNKTKQPKTHTQKE